jgi:hypothetical protein
MVGNCKEVHSPSGLSRMLGLFYVSLEKKTYSKTIPQNQEKTTLIQNKFKCEEIHHKSS